MMSHYRLLSVGVLFLLAQQIFVISACSPQGGGWSGRAPQLLENPQPGAFPPGAPCEEVKLDVGEGDWCWVYQQQIRLGDRIAHHCWDLDARHTLVRGLYDTCQEAVAIYNFDHGVFHGCAELRGVYATKAECISAAERGGATDIELSS